MDFCSIPFLLLFPAAVLIFWLLPCRLRKAGLLVCSLAFALSWGASVLWLLLAEAVFTWMCACRMRRGRKRLWLWAGILGSAGILFGIKLLQIALPEAAPAVAVGMAYYTLQAVTFQAELAKNETQPVPVFLDYLLYLSFFPRFVCGPIQRYGEFAEQLPQLPLLRFDRAEAERGAVQMLCGYAQKLIPATLLAAIANVVFGAPEGYGGLSVFIAMMAFGFSLYFDFAGYSNLAQGAARILSIRLPDNFQRPFLAVSPSEFWRRWHISLSVWLRDYIYIPLGGNRKGKWRKRLNLMITYTVSGLWHGSGWNYILWGALNGFYQVVEDITRPWLSPALERHRDNPMWTGLRRFGNTVLFNYSFLFFRAGSVATGLMMTRNMLLGTPSPRVPDGSVVDGSLLGLGQTRIELGCLCLSLLVAFGLELAAEKAQRQGTTLYDRFCLLHPALRWMVLVLLATFTMLLGCRLVGSDAAGFYYAKF